MPQGQQEKIGDGGPAFPRTAFEDTPGGGGITLTTSGGMSYRQWLAGLAMQAIVSAAYLRMIQVTDHAGHKDWEKTVAEGAVVQADALIAELAKAEGRSQ
jgi:tagatose-1,6-bisphosphate aldolase non-catalytic subunit AgaZ/GatZ